MVNTARKSGETQLAGNSSTEGKAFTARGKLNLTKRRMVCQAHYNTMVHNDEFVMVALTSHDKLGLLIHELLVIEIWKEKVLPHILKALAEQPSNINIHLVLYQETTIVNLLEVILFHREVCEAMDADSLLELTDYCYRKLVYLNTQGAEDAAYKERSGKAISEMLPEEDLQEKAAGMEFGVAVCSISILRYLTDYMGALPLSVMARMLDCHDIIMALVPLVENPPWNRKRTRSGKPVLEKYAEGKWTEVSGSDRFRLMKPDAQLWLCIYNLIVDKRCRLKYNYDDFRRSQVLKLRKYLNNLLVDQLPVLKDLKWAVEQLAIQVPQTGVESASGRLIIEQVPELREKLMAKNNWRVIAQKQLQSVFSEASSATQREAQEMLRLFQFGELMEQPTCAACKKAAVQRCSRCKSEWYCGRECQVSVWKMHKGACDILAGKVEKSGVAQADISLDPT
ncbi:uncharacterized protein [Physcomitrium patens]|uniref:uncharacterized protein isoform X3 n=1 Tax=Physcomitrium patens TaxID=3218 RepID=UPI000D15933C|nr:zinc finger MYND domain-containing protein 10-like isoform X3 [Physcomitrium patens]|eukprot:XP_024390858.1 zinc finger MYND domain-containing protein 10-like isoform X3 [Physcomitrella patens]